MTNLKDPQNNWCTVETLGKRSLSAIKAEILKHESVNERFTLPATPAPARDQTLFKAYRNGDELMIAVAVLESFAPTTRHTTSPMPNRNSIEMFFAPWNDELGWAQFCFGPDGSVQTFHHSPYAQAASTVFSPVSLKRHEWETDTESRTHRLYWLFAWFSVSDVFRAGDVCGFNVVRYSPPLEEWSSWNHASAVGFQDATTFGRLGLRKQGKKDEVPSRVVKLGPPTPTKDFRLSVTYDIPDNIGYSSGYTPKRMEKEFEVWKSYGIERAYWIEYGPLSQWPSLFTPEFYQLKGEAREHFLRNVALTRKTCDDTLKWAVKAAKRVGMEIFAVYKPFDQGFNFSFTTEHEKARVKEIENKFAVAHPDVAANQEFTMRANPAWLRKAVFPITRLCLWSQQPIPAFDPAKLALWTSTDNQKFTKYRGAMKVRVGVVKRAHSRWTPAGKVAEPGSAKNWRIELSELAVKAPFLAIEIEGKRFALSHRMFAFVEAWGKNGTAAPVELSGAGNRTTGYMFNKTWLGWANQTEPIIDTYTWAGPEFCLRFGDAEQISTLLEPTQEGAHRVWMKHIKRILETGVDGVDIRTIGHHSGTESYLKFAFAESVRAEFQRQFGREVEATEEDYQRVRKIRGDAYTRFMAQASALAHSRGQKLAAHIEWGTEVPAHLSLRLQMQMELQWARWISEGIVDEVSLRGWGSLNRHVQASILPLARKHKVGVHVVSTNLAGGLDVRAMELAPRLAVEARDAGFSGYSFYETDSLLRMNAEGYPMPVGLVDEAVKAARVALDREP